MVCGRSPTERSAEQLEPRLLEDASQLLGTTRFGGWKVCKDAFQLLVLAFVHSVECAVSLRDGYKDAFQLLVSALVHWSDWRPSEKTDSASNSLSFNRLNTIVHNTTYLYECGVCEFDL
jgi:hypothetical protein